MKARPPPSSASIATARYLVTVANDAVERAREVVARSQELRASIRRAAEERKSESHRPEPTSGTGDGSPTSSPALERPAPGPSSSPRSDPPRPPR